MWLAVEEDEYNETEATTMSKEEEDDEEDEYSGRDGSEEDEKKAAERTRRKKISGRRNGESVECAVMIMIASIYTIMDVNQVNTGTFIIL